jgi:hypothetical protein
MRGQGSIPGMQSAVCIAGALNDPASADEGWSVVARFPFTGLAAQGHCAGAPRPGDVWRVSASRVQWGWAWMADPEAPGGGAWEKQRAPGRGTDGEDNWTWTAQGVVNMHAPERWGFLRFGGGAGGGAGAADAAEACDAGVAWVPADWDARELLMAAHYLIQDWAAAHGAPPDSLEALGISLARAWPRCGIEQRADGPGGYRAWVHVAPGGGAGARTLFVRGDALLWSEDGWYEG